MKFAVLFCVFLTAPFVKPADDSLSARNIFEGVVNIVIDKALRVVNKFTSYGHNTLEIPNINAVLNYKPLYVQYSGGVTLNHGTLSGLANLQRKGPVKLEYLPNNVAKITATFTFTELLFHYKYSAKIMSLGPKGIVNATLTGLEIKLCASFDLNQYQINVENFDIVSPGTYKYKFTGLPGVNWLSGLLSDVISNSLRDLNSRVVEGKARQCLTNAVNVVNRIVHLGVEKVRSLFHKNSLQPI